ncbi:uncharacterized protein METZ01_LOCUS441594, partial [marine metagenome]
VHQLLIIEHKTSMTYNVTPTSAQATVGR